MNFKLLKQSLPSFCTSNFDVLKIILIFIKFNRLPVLIESTSNQVNQEGGYSGLRPSQFASKLKSLARLININKKSLIIGGDHLGPLPWKDLTSKKAIEKSKILIKECLRAKYEKIHLDTAIKCKDDKYMDKDTTIKRCDEILNSFSSNEINKKFIVVGTEVPIAGGSNLLKPILTSFKSIKEEIEMYSTIFKNKKKYALVIEPGIGFANFKVVKVKFKKLNKILSFSKKMNFAYEAHSTDYQSISSLKKLVKNNFKFLKVGPELTYLFSKAVFEMERIEKEKFKNNYSNIKKTILNEMKKSNKYWKNYYSGSNKYINFLKTNSYLDRMRYYWDKKNVVNAKNKLFLNINKLSDVEFFQSTDLLTKKDLILKKKLKLKNCDLIPFKLIEKSLKKYYLACNYKLKNI